MYGFCFLQHASADVERILIGNKCDWEARRVVSKERGAALAHNQGISFLETSAKTNYNIEEVFETLAKQILRKVRNCCLSSVPFTSPLLRMCSAYIIANSSNINASSPLWPVCCFNELK